MTKLQELIDDLERNHEAMHRDESIYSRAAHALGYAGQFNQYEFAVARDDSPEDGGHHFITARDRMAAWVLLLMYEQKERGSIKRIEFISERELV